MIKNRTPSSTHGDSVICRSSAKVNLTLDILSRRADGYHELSSIVHTVGLWDELRFDFDTEPELHCNRPELTGENNLCLKAMRAWLQAATDCGLAEWRGVRITLHKNIPTGAGLGGGSGNAAATLLALNRRYPRTVPDGKLYQIAASVGADVPLFLRGGCALMEGIGEKLSPLPVIEGWLLIVQPAQTLSTPQVYKAWDALGAASPRRGGELRQTLARSTSSQVQAEKLAKALHAEMLSNDLSAAAHQCGVEVENIAGWLRQCGALAASMTGSGSAVFGLFGSERAAQAALRRLREARTVETQSLSATTYTGNNLSYAAVAPFCRHGVEFISTEQPS